MEPDEKKKRSKDMIYMNSVQYFDVFGSFRIKEWCLTILKE